MVKKQKLLVMFSAFFMAVFVLTGCTSGIRDSVKNATESINDTVSTKVSTIDYMNQIIDAIETPSSNSDYVDIGLTTYYKFIENVPNECNFGSGFEPMEDQSSLIGDNIKLEDESAKEKIEPKFKAFIESYNELSEVATEFADYCEREKYKDDNGEQMETLASKVDEKNIIVFENNEALLDILKEVRESIDLDIDEDTNDPREVITLTIETLTDDVEDAYDAYNVWLEEKVDMMDNEEGGNPDAVDIEEARDKLKANLEKYSKRIEEVNAIEYGNTNGIYLETYFRKVEEFDVEYEKFARDAKNGEITEAQVLKIYENVSGFANNKIYGSYTDVIDEHNNIVDSY